MTIGYRDRREIQKLGMTKIADIKGVGAKTTIKLAKHGYITLKDAQRLAANPKAQQRLIKKEKISPRIIKKVVHVGFLLTKVKTKRKVVIVHLKPWGDSRWKQWGKVIKGYHPKARKGWAFEGKWIYPGYHRLPVGTVILQYGEVGSRKYRVPHVRFLRVRYDGKLTSLGSFKGKDWDLQHHEKIQQIMRRKR